MRRAVLALFLLGWFGTYGHVFVHSEHDHGSIGCPEAEHWACGGCDEEDGHHPHHSPSDHHPAPCPVCAGANAIEAPTLTLPAPLYIERIESSASSLLLATFHLSTHHARGPPLS